ncbi:uncharacterized protein F4822DRAFT_445895 [Hypoxylon trugodes]|uniref:uncharacterized protein n=1 Tax=Hypoxylon trugodes TaxID=326681 RepID=UPI00219BD2BB|nr:uncharacterized protein F4822DRAFT_445895 [Hypoxylon trugodes]KAI1384472.1 hypothetical protein F4822DRAFT_445895 [Hypoxylon trugodes]
MAISPIVPGIKASIVVNGHKIAEYDDPNAQGQVVYKYVECVDNAEFKIHIHVTNEYRWNHPVTHGLNIRCWADGRLLTNDFILQDSLVDNEATMVVYGIRNVITTMGVATVQKCRFSPIATIVNATGDWINKGTAVIPYLGTITVEVRRVVQRRPAGPAEDARAFVSEEAMAGKSITHGTTFSPSMMETDVVSCPGDNNNPVATFHFRYRSRDALQQAMIIPGPH